MREFDDCNRRHEFVSAARLRLARAARAALPAMLAAALVLGGGSASTVGAGEAEAVTVRSVALGGDEKLTTITVELSGEASVGVFAIGDPSRVVIDLPRARFETGRTASGAIGVVSAWRWGAFTADKARMVFDIRTPVRFARVDLVGEGASRRLVLELEASTAEAMRAIRPVHLGARSEPSAAEKPSASEPTGPAAKGDRAVARGPDAAAKRVIVIDPGHGGVDAGTRSPASGTPEKVVVLEVALVLKRHFEATGRYEVHLTRTADVFVGLGERVAAARALKADLLLSVHADAEYDHSVRGATVYTLAEKATDAQAAALAAKENHSDAIAGLIAEAAEPDVADILADLTRRETRQFSHLLARDILDEYRRNGRLVKGAAHRQAGLRVLRAPDVPSVLVEIGFLSNKEDEAAMNSAEWRDATARSLINAVDRFFAAQGKGEEPAR